MDSYKQKYEPWSDSFSVNHKFVRQLIDATRYPDINALVTNYRAYQIYAKYCSKTVNIYREPVEDDVWLRMNVRNQLCKLCHFGVLTRWAPGVYTWNSLLAKYDRYQIMDLINEQGRAALARARKVREAAREEAVRLRNERLAWSESK
jgi:hypothetical protein